MSLYLLPSLLSCLFLPGLGIFVLTRDAKHLVNWSFAVSAFGAAIMEFGHFMLLLNQALFWTKVSLVGICLIPVSLSLFSLIFFRQNARECLWQYRYVVSVISSFSLWFLYLGLSGSLFIKTTQLSFQQFEVYKVQSAGQYFFIFILLSIIFILYNLENTYRNASAEAQWKIRYLVLGIAAVLAFHIFIISYMLLYKTLRVEFFVAEAIVMLISGGLVVFSLVRHRLMGTDVFISRQVVYNSFALMFTGTYLVTIALIGYLVKYQLIEQGSVTQFLVAEIFMYVAILGMAVLLLSGGVRRRVELYISKHFYKHKYEYDEVWIAFTRRIGSHLSLDHLLPQIVGSVQEIVNTDRVILFLYNEQEQQLTVGYASIQLKRPFTIPMSSQFAQYFQYTPAPEIDVGQMKVDPDLQALYAEQREMFESLNVSLCAPLRLKDNFIGLLMVGAERTGEPYSYEDYDLVHTIGIQAASAILNAKLSENLSQARALETFHKFSAFILHDLKNAVQNLSFVVQNAPDYMDDPEFRDDAIKTISDTVTRMNTMITKLSSVPEKLELHLVETKLDEFIADTLRKSKVSKLDHIQIQRDIAEPSLVLSLDYHYFQSVLINLLSNAAESIDGEGEITIRAPAPEHDRVTLMVTDTGCGISQKQQKTLFTPFKSTKQKGLGIGLYQSKTIVEAHGGNIYVESEVQRGTTFRIELPVSPSQ